MTPELKIACELVFQEHKAASHPIAWNRDVFRGRLSTGLSEKAKETLVEKHIICFPVAGKKNQTILNPLAAGASSFEEAADFVLHRVPAMATHDVQPAPIGAHKDHPTRSAYTNSVTAYLNRSVAAPRLVTITGKAEALHHHEPKWYMKPVLLYIVWPLLAAVAGGIIAYLIGEAYTELMFDLKK